MTDQERPTIREAVAVFYDADDLEAAVDELRAEGFDRAEISLLADEETVEKKLGHLLTKVATVEDDPNVPRTAFVSTAARGEAEGAAIGALAYVGAVAAAGAAVASGGTLLGAALAAAAAGGAGGLVGSVLAEMIAHEHAERIAEQLDVGGLALWVHTRDRVHEDRAKFLLAKHHGHDVHVHTIRA